MIFSQVAGLHVGTVETCSPTEIKVLLDSDAPQDIAFNAGRPQGFPRLNGYVLVPNEGGAVVAVISRMAMEPAPLPGGYGDPRQIALPASRRRLFVTPIGTLETARTGDRVEHKLRRGVVSYPAVGDAVTLPIPDQLKAIVEATGPDARVQIGTSRIALDTPVTVDPDKLFGRHVGVFGNTGSGKSCTVAGLIRWSVEAAFKGPEKVAARFVVLDPNGEYRTCFNDLKDKIDVEVFSVEPGVGEKQLVVPGWMWNGEEWATALDASPATQRPILMQAVRQLRGAALHAGSGDPTQVAAPDGHIIFSVKMRAYVAHLQAMRARGVAHLGNFPVFSALHVDLESLETQLRGFEQTVQDTDLAAAVDKAAEASRIVRARRTNGTYKNHFVDGDLAEVVDALSAVVVFLPEASFLTGPSEDTPAPFELSELPGMIELLAGLQAGNVQQHMAGLDLRVRTMLADNRIIPIIQPVGPKPAFSDWLQGILGRSQITVIDLSLVPTDVLTTLVAVLGRIVFEAGQRYRRMHKVTLPTVLVLEEAHNFVQRPSNDAGDSAGITRCRHVFERIAKEGRKFGVGLMLSSQRPAELSATVVAQCNSFVLHRIVNDRDQELVSRLAPDTSGNLLKELPSLPTQKAILMGIAAEIPVVFDVKPLADNLRPSSSNPDFWRVWTGARQLDEDLQKVAADWGGPAPKPLS
jgi:hypothetical protein